VHDIVEDLADVLFPRCAGFGVSLQGLEHWYVVPTSGQLPFHDEIDTSRRSVHRQSKLI
jgi:hypothetical protein